MKNWLRFLALPLLLGVSACGDDPTPASTCKSLDQAQCAKQFKCYTEEQRMQLGITGTEADCPAARDTSRQTTLGFTCDDFTAEKSNCAAGQTYNTEKAASCKDIVAKLTCEEWLADSTPGDCNMICQ